MAMEPSRSYSSLIRGHDQDLESVVARTIQRLLPGFRLPELGALQSELAAKAFGPQFVPPERTDFVPAMDVFTRGSDLVIRTLLPGVDPAQDIDIEVRPGALTIRGQRRHEEQEQGDHYYRSEVTYGAFQRTIPLPRRVRTPKE